ncbi:SGNH/GDSL hydrolase family protein [Lignipirellula cremea]|uniref:Acyl-CoA thioesterase I n=1 Tax=Lignipirellula cremea TaxID=2528010 RepID=A0A518DQZ6_9BACT|nr:SGNH/GDSL hydrolase family protein [Lignipirellula cremea]QDU94266.1 Acyl-CoA thioesterase I precursor [Lignipirellula cremea]
MTIQPVALFALLLAAAGGAFVASGSVDAAELIPLEPPSVVIIGDSIRLSYADEVTAALRGKARIVSPRPNGGDSKNVLANIKNWAIDEQPNVVHFNCGIHDTKKFTATGEFQVSPEQYEANLRAIVARLRDETNAVVLFATTTPIVDEWAAKARVGRDYALLEASVEQYNAIAERVMKELKVPVNDLHALTVKDAPKLINSDGVHMNAEGQKLIGQAVADFIEKHLPAAN